jgi:hypothetical protein
MNARHPNNMKTKRGRAPAGPKSKGGIGIGKWKISERNFIIAASLFSIVLYASFCLSRTLAPDETGNLLLGKKILQLQYPEDFLQRMPLVPMIISAFFILGLQPYAILIVIPLLFILLSVPITYFFARQFAGARTAALSVVSLLVFFVFWRWGIYVLTDIPLMVFMTLSLHFFLKGLKDERNFYYFGLFLGLSSITKLTFIILPLLILAYIAVAKKASLLRKRKLWIGVLMAIAIFSAAFAATYIMKQSVSADMAGRIEDRLSGERDMVIMQILTGAEYTSATQFLQLALFPLLVFAPFAVCRKFHMKRLLLAYIGIFLLFFVTIWVVRLRYFSPLYPVVMILIAEGYFFLREHCKKQKKIVDAAFVLLAAASLMNTFYLISLDSGSLWGADQLAAYTSGLDGLIASDYLPHYLNLTGDVMMNTTVTKAIFYGNFSDGLLKENSIKYVVLSLYDEWNRRPDTSASFHPYFGPIEIPFISRPYSNGRIPPDYSFESALYRELASDPSLRKINEIKKGEQTVFIVYEVS